MISIDQRVPAAGYLHAVSPSGYIKALPLWPHMSDEVVRRYVVPTADGRETEAWELTPRAKAAGWMRLDEVYREENREDDWQAYLQWFEARQRGPVEPLPDEYLPDVVLSKRPGERKPFALPAKAAPTFRTK